MHILPLETGPAVAELAVQRHLRVTRRDYQSALKMTDIAFGYDQKATGVREKRVLQPRVNDPAVAVEDMMITRNH